MVGTKNRWEFVSTYAKARTRMFHAMFPATNAGELGSI